MSTAVYVKENYEKWARNVNGTNRTNSRVMTVLNFMAEHPTESFTLSQLAKGLGLSLGSAHRVLSTMTEFQYLYRHPVHKTYSLGVALVAIGQAALAKNHGVDMARSEAYILASELNVQCMVTAVVDHEVVFLAREGQPQSNNGLHRVGERRSSMPPFNLTCMAWADRETLDDYFRMAGTYLDTELITYIRRALPVIRARGYAMAANGPALRRLTQQPPLPLGRAHSPSLDHESSRIANTLSRNEIFLKDPVDLEEGIAYITAPIFSPSGAVAFELTLTGLPEELDAISLKRYINRVCATAELITNKTYGKPPVIRRA